jgi:hypothetical protein
VSGRAIIFGSHFNSSGQRLVVIYFNSDTSYATNGFEAANPTAGTFQYYEIEVDATTIYYRMSSTGAAGSFVEIFSSAKAAWLTNAVDQVGLGAAPFGANSPTVEADWFRRAG